MDLYKLILVGNRNFEINTREIQRVVSRENILKALEEARSAKVIGKSFNAKLTITLDSKAKEVFAPLFESAAQILIVSQIEFVDGDEFKVVVNAAEGALCSRCWMIVPQINEDELCPRCAKIVKQ